MSEKKADNVPKRFFVAGTLAMFKRLQILSIQLDAGGVEKLAAKLLEKAIAEAEAEQAKPDKGKR